MKQDRSWKHLYNSGGLIFPIFFDFRLHQVKKDFANRRVLDPLSSACYVMGLGLVVVEGCLPLPDIMSPGCGRVYIG